MTGRTWPPPSPGGRRFTATRRVGLGDTTADDRLRLDALARYLQDVATDDAEDVGLAAGAWVLRTVELALVRLPARGESVVLTTFCSGVGRSVAERRTTLTDAAGDVVAESAAVWVYLDPRTGRPGTLGEWFEERYGLAGGGRRVSGRLRLPDPPGAGAVGPATGLSVRRWPLRATDLDVLGHVNNAAYWEPVEDVLAREAPDQRPVSARAEFRGGILLDEPIDLVTRIAPSGDHLDAWLVCAGDVRSSVVVTLSAP